MFTNYCKLRPANVAYLIKFKAKVEGLKIFKWFEWQLQKKKLVRDA
jgi:hypothetical protein